jgi:hypothetical protein
MGKTNVSSKVSTGPVHVDINAPKPVAPKPAAVKPDAAKPAAAKPAAAKPAAAKPAAAKPAAAKPAAAKPAAAKPAASKTELEAKNKAEAEAKAAKEKTDAEAQAQKDIDNPKALDEKHKNETPENKEGEKIKQENGGSASSATKKLAKLLGIAAVAFLALTYLNMERNNKCAEKDGYLKRDGDGTCYDQSHINECTDEFKRFNKTNVIPKCKNLEKLKPSEFKLKTLQDCYEYDKANYPISCNILDSSSSLINDNMCEIYSREDKTSSECKAIDDETIKEEKKCYIYSKLQLDTPLDAEEEEAEDNHYYLKNISSIKKDSCKDFVNLDGLNSIALNDDILEDCYNKIIKVVDPRNDKCNDLGDPNEELILDKAKKMTLWDSMADVVKKSTDAAILVGETGLKVVKTGGKLLTSGVDCAANPASCLFGSGGLGNIFKIIIAVIVLGILGYLIYYLVTQNNNNMQSQQMSNPRFQQTFQSSPTLRQIPIAQPISQSTLTSYPAPNQPLSNITPNLELNP